VKSLSVEIEILIGKQVAMPPGLMTQLRRCLDANQPGNKTHSRHHPEEKNVKLRGASAKGVVGYEGLSTLFFWVI